MNGATAQTYPFILEEEDSEGPFRYIDTASSRAEIVTVTQKLALGSIAIVGLGGSGSYILDLAAKTPVREIHLYDGDVLSQHNAFRSPGAASADDLKARMPKVTYFRKVYDHMRKGIVEQDRWS